MQPLKMLPKPFKAATTNNGMNTNLTAVAAAVNSTFSMLSAVPQSSFYNMMHGSKQLVQSKLKQTYSGSLFCILQDQNFHTSTAIQKEEKGTGNGMDKGGANNNDNLEGETISESILEFEPISKAGVRRPGRGPLCKCGRPLRKLQSTLNNNEFILECTSCGTLYDSGGSSMDSTRQEIRRRLDEIDKCPTPKQMTAYLDKFVIGQDGAKRDLSLGVYEHYIRIGMNDEFRQKRRGNQIHQGSLARQLISNHLVAGSPTISFERLPYSNDVTKQQQQQKPKNRSLPFQFDVGKLAEGDFVRMDKSNILLLGPSGVGKTYMIKILAEYLKVPMAHSDCTSMTQAGYVGEDVESVLTKLLQEADGNVTKAEMGIVFLDEIDKIASTREFASTSYRDVSGEGVQHAMLKMIEGTIVNVKSGKKCNQETVQVDTSDILFIGSGAFTGIDKQISRRLQKLTVGFGAAPPLNVITQDDKEQEVINEKRDRLLKEVQADDVIKFGMIPELVGRFPIRVPFYSLNKELLKRVMMEPEHSMLAQARVFFKLHDAKLEFTDEALDEIAGKAIKDKTGARALISILNEVLKDAKYNLPGAGVDTVRITGEFIRGESNYEVIMKSKARQHPQVIHLHAPTVAAAV